MVYLVDSAGARITDQVDLFPGRRGAGQHLLQPGPRLRARSRRCARCSARRPPAAPTSRRSATWWRWSRATPRCTSARTAWSRWSPARRPRSRRWAARGSTVLSPASATSCARPRPRRSTWSGATCPTCRPTGRARPPAAAAAGAVRRRPRRAGAGQRAAGVRHARASSRACSTTDSYFEIQALWARELTVGFGRLDGEVVGVVGQQLAAQGRRAVRRLGRQGDPVRAAVRRVQRAAAVPVRRARLHGRHGGGEAGHHPARRQDDHRDRRGDRAEDLRGGPQGVRRRALRDGRARASRRTPRSRCRPRRSP